MDKNSLFKYVNKSFNSYLLPNLMNFVRIPNTSTEFDPDWKQNGLLLKACNSVINYAKSLNIKGAEITLLQDEGYTPFILIDIPSTRQNDTRSILLYGHVDKQPEGVGWDKDKSATKPVIENGRLYGRGTVDDGYASFSVLTAIKCCQDHDCLLPRIICIFESNEESSEEDLHHYFEKLMPFFGDNISLFCCIDLGCLDYDRMWVVNCIRGVVDFDVEITTLNSDYDSNYIKGVIPDNFTILRKLVDMIRDENGNFLIPELVLSEDDIPKERLTELRQAADKLGNDFIKQIPLYDKTLPMETEIYKLLFNNIWKVSMILKGVDGIPDNKNEGNIMTKSVTAKLQLRLPPLINGEEAMKKIIEKLTKNTPFNAKVEVKVAGSVSDGWNGKGFSDRTKNIFNYASQIGFGNGFANKFGGGSVPFIRYFENKYPNTDIANIGLLGYECNEHGPNESLNLEACKKFIAAMAILLSEF